MQLLRKFPQSPKFGATFRCETAVPRFGVTVVWVSAVPDVWCYCYCCCYMGLCSMGVDFNVLGAQSSNGRLPMMPGLCDAMTKQY